LVALAVVVSGLLFTRNGLDLFGVPRWTVLVAAGLYFGVYATVQAFGPKALVVDRTVAAVLGVLGLLLVVAAVHSDVGWQAVVGPPNRMTGIALYGACIALFLAASQLDESGWQRLVPVFTVVLGLVTVYGLLQWRGHDPLDWPGADLSTVFATFGQTNFASGWVAIALPLTVAVVLGSSTAPWLRVVAAMVAVGALIFLGATNSFQGFPAAFAGIVVVIGTFGICRAGGWRRAANHPTVRFVTGGVVVLVVALALVPAVRHDVRSKLDSGLHERLMLWDAGAAMVRDDPLLGKGMAMYGAEFPKYRSARHALEFGSSAADAAHDVPLELAVDGGVLLLLAYLAFVGLTGFRLVRGLSRSSTPLLAAVGGAWLAYQVQSLVSIDVPALAVMHWVLAGGIFALTRDKAPARTASARSNSDRTVVAVSIAFVVTAVLAPWWTRPIRADVIAHDGLALASEGRVPEAVSKLEHATRLSPWNSVYWARLANVYQMANLPDASVQAAERAIDAAPGIIQYRINLAQLAAALGNDDLAAEQYDEAIRLDPHNKLIREEAATWRSSATP
jgi:hypothetical protein